MRFQLLAASALLILGACEAFAPSSMLPTGRRGSATSRSICNKVDRCLLSRTSTLLPALRASATETEDFLGVDANGNPVQLTIQAKEKLFLDACSAFHNDGKQLLSDEEYEKLKKDLAFEGSSLTMMSREEIRFMVAAARWQEGRPIMPDEEFDTLRRKLKEKNSPAVLHKVSPPPRPAPPLLHPSPSNPHLLPTEGSGPLQRRERTAPFGPSGTREGKGGLSRSPGGD